MNAADSVRRSTLKVTLRPWVAAAVLLIVFGPVVFWFFGRPSGTFGVMAGPELWSWRDTDRASGGGREFRALRGWMVDEHLVERS